MYIPVLYYIFFICQKYVLTIFHGVFVRKGSQSINIIRGPGTGAEIALARATVVSQPEG